MKEFGSDFHKCDSDFQGASNYFDVLGDVRLYASGRHAIEAILKYGGWKRIWIPAYFCYEVIGYIKSIGIEVCLYDDFPLCENENEIIYNLPYRKGDVLFRMNYFGFRRKRSNKNIAVPVIEDHTHGVISCWALKSDADYCIVSLRKSLPIAAGGILWSPKQFELPKQIEESVACRKMAEMRFDAMKLKAVYLREGGDKNIFRDKYIESEECIDSLSLTGMDCESEKIVRGMNIKLWLDLKRDNWYIAKGLLDRRFCILESTEDDLWYPFSLTLLCKSNAERERLRKYMIGNCIYPAILWELPDNSLFFKAKDFSDRMLSVHCDARYSRNDIYQMCNLLNKFYDTNI